MYCDRVYFFAFHHEGKGKKLTLITDTGINVISFLLMNSVCRCNSSMATIDGNKSYPSQGILYLSIS